MARNHAKKISFIFHGRTLHHEHTNCNKMKCKTKNKCKLNQWRKLHLIIGQIKH